MSQSETTSSDFGLLSGAIKDPQSITREWQFLKEPIDGVKVKEVRHVPKENGYLTEIWRSDWAMDSEPVDQIFQVKLKPGGISAWHTHQVTLDRLFVNDGVIKVVLYDARKDSPTHGMVNVFRLGTIRPALVVVPAGVWHGLQNISNEPALVLNLVDKAYQYENPDHWRLPMNTDQIPYRFEAAING